MWSFLLTFSSLNSYGGSAAKQEHPPYVYLESKKIAEFGYEGLKAAPLAECVLDRSWFFLMSLSYCRLATFNLMGVNATRI